MGSGFSKMKKQAKMMQEKVSQMREQMASKSVEGQAGGGLVRVTLSGEKELKSLIIKPECVDPKEVEALQDLIIAAFEDAHKKLKSDDSLSTLPFPLAGMQ